MIARCRHALVVAVATLAFSQVSVAADESATRDEIDHLLKFVGSSSCTFVRNGDEYPADQAREHLASKYRVAGARISTAEEFIKYLATASSMSGKPYHVKCGKTDALSGVWLGDELARYRKVQRVSAAR